VNSISPAHEAEENHALRAEQITSASPASARRVSSVPNGT
jgi:hypothetical protein